jgi:hypothetical protein
MHLNLLQQLYEIDKHKRKEISSDVSDQLQILYSQFSVQTMLILQESDLQIRMGQFGKVLLFK